MEDAGDLGRTERMIEVGDEGRSRIDSLSKDGEVREVDSASFRLSWMDI